MPNPPKDSSRNPDTTKPADTSSYGDKTGLTILTLRPQLALLRVKDRGIRFQLADPPGGWCWTGYHLYAAGLGDLGLTAPYEKRHRLDQGPFTVTMTVHPFSQYARPGSSNSRWQLTPAETRFASLTNMGT